MKTLFCAVLISVSNIPFAYTQTDVSTLPYQKIYTHCLDADVKSAAQIVRVSKSSTLDQNEKLFIEEFEARFSYPTDSSTFLEKRKSPIDELVKRYREYHS